MGKGVYVKASHQKLDHEPGFSLYTEAVAMQLDRLNTLFGHPPVNNAAATLMRPRANTDPVQDWTGDDTGLCKNLWSAQPVRSRFRSTSSISSTTSIYADDCPNQWQHQPEQENQEQSPPTSMMIRNLPTQYTKEEFVDELAELGFTDAFDFLHLPVDKGGVRIVGCAFVNFVNSIWAEKCVEVLEGYMFKKHQNSDDLKFATVSVAVVQGLEANLRHLRKTAAGKHQRRKAAAGKNALAKLNLGPCA